MSIAICALVLRAYASYSGFPDASRILATADAPADVQAKVVLIM